MKNGRRSKLSASAASLRQNADQDIAAEVPAEGWREAAPN